MIFITGGTGLVGSHLILELIKKDKNVTVLKRKNSDVSILSQLCGWYGIDPELLKKVTWIEGDLCVTYSYFHYLKEIKEVYHCAALVSFNQKDYMMMVEANVDGTANLINSCLELGIDKFCHVSSIASFGNVPSGMESNEDILWNSSKGRSGYSISKYMSEMEVWRGIAEGLNAVIVNPSIILGPGNWHKGSQRMFSEINKGMKFYTNGSSGFVDVRDVVAIMLKLMNEEIYGRRFCLNSENISYKQVLSMIADALQVTAPTILATSGMLKVAAALEWFRSKLLQTEPRISRESARSAVSQSSYSNNRIVELLDYQFIPVSESVNQIADVFLNKSSFNSIESKH